MRINSTFAVPMHDLSIEEVLDFCLAPGGYRMVVTPNVDHMCRLYQQRGTCSYYTEADLCVCDSKVLQLFSYLCFRPIHHVVRGSDLTHRLLERLPSGRSVFIVGDDESQAELIAKRYKLEDVSIYVPPWGFAKNDAEIEKTLNAIQSADADVLLLGVGSPAQEKIAHQLKPQLQKGVALCCGNSVNFCTGLVSRSPRWMSRVGIEWLHRILMEPRRLGKRYFGNLMIFWYVLRSKLS